MAIYHFSMRHISRSTGRSATASSAYRGGLDITDERTGERFNYTNKGKNGVLDHTILTPNRAPDWAKEASSLWNTVEKFEKRKDARVVRENIVALPCELSLEQNREMLHDFVQEAYIKRGMVAQINIHAPDGKGDNRNIHAHIMLTPRQITRNGFKEKKPVIWNENSTLLEWRKMWEVHLNSVLEKAGHDTQVDSRSFKDQEIEKMPTIHMGVEATAMERRGEKSLQGEKNKAVEAFNKNLADLKEQKKVIDLAIEREKRENRRKEVLDQAKQQRRENIKETLQKNKRKNKYPAESVGKKDVLQDNNIFPKKRKKPHDHRKIERYKLEDRQREELHEFEAKSFDKREREKEKLDKYYKPQKHKRKLREAEKVLTNSQGWFSRVTGKTKALEQDVDDLRRNLDGVTTLQKQGETMFNARLSQDKKIITQRHEKERRDFEKTLTQKTETAKTFEKAVLKKEVANENEKAIKRIPKKQQTRDR